MITTQRFCHGNTLYVYAQCALVTGALLFTGCSQQTQSQYEFHTGGNGLIIWRCDRLTGEVDVTDSRSRSWQRVTNRTDQARTGHTP
jgi:hypothetical protein